MDYMWLGWLFLFFFNLYSFSQRSFSLLQYSMVFYAKLVISQCYSFLCFANLTCSLPLPVLSSPHVIHSFICLSVHLSSWLHADLEMESVIEDSTWVADPLNHYSISSGRQKPDLCVFYHPPLTKIIIIKLWSMSLQCVPLILLLSVVIYDYVKGSFVWIEDDSLSNTSDSVVRIWEGLNGVCVCVCRCVMHTVHMECVCWETKFNHNFSTVVASAIICCRLNVCLL